MGHDPRYRRPTDAKQTRRSMLGNARSEAGDLTQALALLHGIQKRDPTAYRPLVEFCFSIPDDQYLRAGQTRWRARRLLRGKVPDMVVDEPRKGLQAADWDLRFGRQRAAYRAELDRLSADPAMAHRFDLPKLQAALDTWPAQTRTSASEAWWLKLALSRTLSTARFIRFVEGGNAG